MKIAFAGKGGVGKTTAAAWLGEYLARRGEDVWLVDADTALSLGAACGLGPEDLPESLAKREEVIREYVGEGLMSLNPDMEGLPEKLAVELPVLGPVEPGRKPGRKRLLLMGGVDQGGGGCACASNALLKAFVAHMMFREGSHVLLDMEAGVEHLGRGTAAVADGVVVVSEPSLRSLLTAAEVARMARQLGLTRQVLLLNRQEGAAKPAPGPGREALQELPQRVVNMPVLEELRQRQWEDGSVLFASGPARERADAMCAELLRALTE